MYDDGHSMLLELGATAGALADGGCVGFLHEPTYRSARMDGDASLSTRSRSSLATRLVGRAASLSTHGGVPV